VFINEASEVRLDENRILGFNINESGASLRQLGGGGEALLTAPLGVAARPQVARAGTRECVGEDVAQRALGGGGRPVTSGRLAVRILRVSSMIRRTPNG
jgi:hypothetical protein